MLLVIVGMQSEAALLPKGTRTLISGADPERLAALLAAEGDDVTAVLSFGIAGALDPDLRPGDLIAATRIRGAAGAWPADMAWAARLARATAARLGVVAGANAAAADAGAKKALREMTGALAVDMESQVAAAFAARRALPFAALRAIADTAEEALPKAALVGLTKDGRPAPFRVLLALARKPADLRPLRVVAARSRTALQALGHGVHLLRGNLRSP
jgi:hopanoid-associated phosphorylase